MQTAFHDPLIVPLNDGRWLGLSTDLRIAGVQARLSDDLLTWGEPFPLLKETPVSVKRHAQTDRFWAPELVKRGDTWRLYCCASRFGTTQSVIGLAEAKEPLGPYAYVGDVVRSQHSATFTQANAIDPCVVADRDGRDWLIYGSFFGGIRILPLHEDGFPAECHEGKPIAGGGHRAIEGAYACYQPEFDRFVLFTSWGDLHKDYHVRVGYSKDISGPYLDSNGFALTDPDPVHIPGDKLCGGYNFDLPGMDGVMATGHNSLCQGPDGLYMVHHARPEGDVRHPFMQMRRILTMDDGRICAWPLTYDGQPLTNIDELPCLWRMVYLSRSNMGVVYGRQISRDAAQMALDSHALTMNLYHKHWKGFAFRQGDRVACSLLSEDGEALWGVAEN